MKKLLTLFTALLLLGSMTFVQADTWTVAGSNTTILGYSWAPSQTVNDMKNTDGSNWYLLKVNKTIGTATSMEYKVVKNHNWDNGSKPSNNASLSLPKGTYDVIFKYYNNNDVSATTVTSWTVAGTSTVMGSDWSANDNNNKMTRSGSNYTLTKSNVSLRKNTNYECKVLANQEWTYSFPSSNKVFTVSNDGIYNVTFTFNTSTFAVTVTTTYVSPLPVTLHSNITNPSWETSAAFAVASGNATASLTIQNVAKGDYEFGIKIDGEWRANKAAITRTNHSADIPASNTGNCTFKADILGNYTFTWTYATNTLDVTYQELPAQSVSFSGLASQIHMSSTPVAFAATSTGITNPTYTYYVKPKDGEYGSSCSSYIFNTVGEYVVKVSAEGDNTIDPVVTEENVEVYDTYTFHAGDVIKVDFSAMTEGSKAVNFPFDHVATDPNEPLAYDANGAGTVKTITFTEDVEWNTLQNFIKTEKAGWGNGLKFKIPAAKYNVAKVAADGASFSWIFVPSVEIVGVADSYLNGESVTLSASTNLSNPSYTYQVKYEEGEFATAANPYTFAAPGTYTFKVLAHGDEDDADATKVVTVYEPQTLYFINKESWEGVKIYFYDPEKTAWPGDAMTLTASTTDFHNYKVYSFTIPKGIYSNVVFNGSSKQTVNLTIDDTKHYFMTSSTDGDGKFQGQWYTTLEECDPLPVIKMHGNFLGEWNTTDAFVVAGNKQTASLEITINTKGAKEFGMRIGANDNWTSNGSTFTRANSSHAITSGEGNCSLDVDAKGKYTYIWTFASNTLSVTYPEMPTQTVTITGLTSPILKGTEVTFAVESSGIDAPGYRYYVKEKDGEYGEALESNVYPFNTAGKFVVKVEALEDNIGDPVAFDEVDVTVYETYTFTSGSRIYIDFTAMTEGAKGVNFPFGHVATTDPLDYDENGAGTFKTIQFSEDVEWSTLQDFIKTAKTEWAGLKFTVPGDGQNKIIVAADGASYTWGTYTPETVQVKFFAPRDESSNWDHVYAHSWDAAGDITSWPGDEITSSKVNNWYVYNVQVGASLLFHNNSGMQTNDITNIQAAACYEPTSIYYPENPEDAKIVTVTVNTGCEIAYYIAGSTALVGGTNDFDTNVALDENNQIVFYNVEPGTYAFKINNNTWAWSIGGYDHMKEGDCATIATTVGEGDLGFNIATIQDVTVTYYPETEEICLGAVTVKTQGTVSVADMKLYVDEAVKPTITTNMADTTAADVSYTILSGSEYISIENGKITGVAEGEAEVKINIAETDLYLAATDTFTVKVAPLALYLVGDFNEWVPGDVAYKFTVDGGVATRTFAVTADSAVYEFKIYDKLNNNGWMGANYNFNYYWNTDVQMVYEETQANLNAFKAGTYTFEYTISSGKLTIHFKETDATEVAISQYEYATLYSAKGFDVPDEVEAYIITGLDGIHLTTERIYRIPANTGVLLHAPQGNYDFYEGDSRYMGVDVSANMLKGTVADQVINNELVHYILSLNNENVVGLYWPYGTGSAQGIGSFENKAGKAYLEIPAASQPQSVVARRGFPLSPGAGMPTGIEMTNDQLQITNKRIVNGQLYIIIDGATYNAQGARVQ